MFQIISGTSKTVSGTQNVERNVPNTAHKNVPDISLLLGTLFLLVFPVSAICALCFAEMTLVRARKRKIGKRHKAIVSQHRLHVFRRLMQKARTKNIDSTIQLITEIDESDHVRSCSQPY